MDASDAANPKACILSELLTSSQCVTSWCPFQVLQEGSCSTAPVKTCRDNKLSPLTAIHSSGQIHTAAGMAVVMEEASGALL